MIDKEKMSKEQLKIVVEQAKEALQRVEGGDGQDVSAMYDVLRFAQAGFFEVVIDKESAAKNLLRLILEDLLEEVITND